jgi:acyl-CoA reductase-like NAD-dependent aldehyde dehydrogenase
MPHLPALRWGDPYKSLEVEKLAHFATGEPVAEMSKVTGGLVERDMRHAKRARHVLCDVPATEIIARLKNAGQLFLEADLPLGDGTQSPEEFARMQSATTGLPLHMCRANMQKNHFVLAHMDQILDALTRGLDPAMFAKGYAVEGRGVPVSYQAQSPVLGMVLPNNSPGVHALWLPVVAMQVGLVIKPGSAEPWTPFRMVQAFLQAGIPKQAISFVPGGHDVGGAVMSACQRSLIFGGQQTVDQYKGNPRVSVHGPGFSKIILGNDTADDWQKYLDVMVDSVLLNGGRSCINASGIWTPRHGKAIAHALAERLGPIAPLPPEDDNAKLAAFTLPNLAEAIWGEIERESQANGVEDMTAKFGPRLVKAERHAYLRPMVVSAASPEPAITRKEYLFPFVSVVECPQEKMLDAIGPTLVGTAITRDTAFQRALLDCVHIDRLNLGPIPTTRINWLQPHEGNIVDFLFRARAFQFDPGMLKG